MEDISHQQINVMMKNKSFHAYVQIYLAQPIGLAGLDVCRREFPIKMEVRSGGSPVLTIEINKRISASLTPLISSVTKIIV